MSRAKRLKMKNRLKREVNDLMTAGVKKQPSRKLIKQAKLYSVSLNKYHKSSRLNTWIKA